MIEPPTNRKGTDPMARGKAISVKIATPKVIKALETKLAEVNTNYANQEANEAKHKKAMEKWQKEMGKLALSAMSKAQDVSAHTRYNGEINLSFSLPAGSIDLPKEPEKDFDTIHQWQYKEIVDEIENAIRILKMTDEEVVNTSTYNAVARYL
jgi:predicted ATP-dependent endonuclease of OLD family